MSYINLIYIISNNQNYKKKILKTQHKSKILNDLTIRNLIYLQH